MHPRVLTAVHHGGVRNPDERGLMPLAEARAILRGVRAFVKGEGELQDDIGNVLASDMLWAALLSLEDCDEFVAAASRLDWQFHPRGFENVDLHLRYGDGIAAWIATRVDDVGAVAPVPWCLVPCLYACDGADAFALAWRITAPRDVLRNWLDRHPATGVACLRALDDRRAAAHLRGLELRGLAPAPPPGPPTAARVLATLDACADRLAGGAAIAWPALDGTGPRRPHGFRAIAARDGDDWGLAIERVEGERAGGVHGARVAVFAYGSRLPRGWSVSARPLALAPPSQDTAAWLTAQTVRDPDSVFGPAAPPPGLGAAARLVAVVPSLAHVAAEPSASAVYRALAAAIAGP